MPTEYPASAVSGEALADFAERVARLGSGRLTVRPSYDAALGLKSAEMVEAVRDGRIEAADAFGGGLAGTDPIFGLSSLPFVSNSVPQAKRLAEAARPVYDRAFAARGLRLLFVTPWPPTGLWSKTPLASVADLRSLSVRTYDPASTEVLTGAGARAFNISFADAEAKLRDGGVNAVLSSGDGGAGRRLWDLLPHFTEITYAVPLSVAFVSSAAYEALAPDLRGAVDRAAAETEARGWAAMTTRLDANYARMRQNGVTIRSDPDPAMMGTLKGAAAQVVKAWAERTGPDGRALLDTLGAK